MTKPCSYSRRIVTELTKHLVWLFLNVRAKSSNFKLPCSGVFKNTNIMVTNVTKHDNYSRLTHDKPPIRQLYNGVGFVTRELPRTVALGTPYHRNRICGFYWDISLKLQKVSLYFRWQKVRGSNPEKVNSFFLQFRWFSQPHYDPEVYSAPKNMNMKSLFGV
jgi:hypothetical protein